MIHSATHIHSTLLSSCGMSHLRLNNIEEEREWRFLCAYIANTMEFVFHVFYDPLVVAISHFYCKYVFRCRNIKDLHRKYRF